MLFNSVRFLDFLSSEWFLVLDLFASMSIFEMYDWLMLMAMLRILFYTVLASKTPGLSRVPRLWVGLITGDLIKGVVYLELIDGIF